MSNEITINGKKFRKSLFYPAGQEHVWNEHKTKFYSDPSYTKQFEEHIERGPAGLTVYSRFRSENGMPANVIGGGKRRRRR
jgi:hypothetical protein